MINHRKIKLRRKVLYGVYLDTVKLIYIRVALAIIIDNGRIVGRSVIRTSHKYKKNVKFSAIRVAIFCTGEIFASKVRCTEC